MRAAQEGGDRVTSGAVELVFAQPRGERTIIRRQFANYPFHICRGFNFDGDPQGMSTVYLQSLAGLPRTCVSVVRQGQAPLFVTASCHMIPKATRACSTS